MDNVHKPVGGYAGELPGQLVLPGLGDDYVCDRCGRPADRLPSGVFTHRYAADAAFCALVYPQ